MHNTTKIVEPMGSTGLPDGALYASHIAFFELSLSSGDGSSRLVRFHVSCLMAVENPDLRDLGYRR